MNIISKITSVIRKKPAKCEREFNPIPGEIIIQQKFQGTDVLTGAVRVLDMLPHPTEWSWGTTVGFGVALIHKGGDDGVPYRIIAAINHSVITLTKEYRFDGRCICSSRYVIHDWEDMYDRKLADHIQPAVLAMFPDPRLSRMAGSDFDGDNCTMRA